MGRSSFALGFKYTNASGTTDTAPRSEAIITNTMVHARGPSIWPLMPPTMAMGTYTTTVVMVEASTEAPTSPAPRKAASRKGSFSSRIRKQLSSTTMELSTIMPMARISAPPVITFSE